MKTVTPRSVAARKYVRLSCSDSEESDDDMLSVAAVRPLTTAAPLGGARMMESDDDVLSVGAVRPLANAAPLGGAGMMDDCQQRADAKDNVFPMNRPGMCCARLDDFDWVIPHYDPDMLLSGRDMEVGVTDISQDIRVLPDAFPVMFDKKAAVPMPLPVVVGMESQVDYDPDTLLSGRDMEVGVLDINQDICVLLDAFPVMFDEKTAMPMSLPAVVETGPQVGC